MKSNLFGSISAGLAIGGVVFSAATVSAQDDTNTAATPATVAAAPAASPEGATAAQLAYGASQILQLAQAKVADDIIAYIKNSGNSYALNAGQIIYLQQQGLSSPVINAMLSQPKAGVLAYAPAPAAGTEPPAQPMPDSQPTSSTSIVGPAVTAIDPTAAAVYASPYYQPCYYPYSSYPYYYPAYGYGFYPGVSVSVGFGRGWGGYGWRGGGFHGGFHR